VITHTDPISVPGWSGAGYVITDPETGAGAWKIGGGLNGGFMIGFSIGVSTAILFLAALPALTNPVTAEAGVIALALVGGMLLYAVALYNLFGALFGADAQACFLGGIVAGISVALLAGGVTSAAAGWIGFILSQAGFAGKPAAECL
jgi:hypothetical protein